MPGVRVGYLDLDAADAKLLFQVFTDPRLCAAIVDRLTYNAQIIETGSQSYRLAQTARARAGQ